MAVHDKCNYYGYAVLDYCKNAQQVCVAEML
jgi:hypothetical protein